MKDDDDECSKEVEEALGFSNRPAINLRPPCSGPNRHAPLRATVAAHSSQSASSQTSGQSDAARKLGECQQALLKKEGFRAAV